MIYHSLDDYLVNANQLALLKDYCRKNLVLLNNGSHLGFLYRKEFLNSLKSEIPDIEMKNEIEYEKNEDMLLNTVLGGV